MNYFKIINELKTKEERLSFLKNLKSEGAFENIKMGDEVNNHIHTIYSFSPYTPTGAIVKAYTDGLKVAGIMDHDSISGAREFIEAGKVLGIKTTIGIECRVNVKDTPIEDKRINNPDQKGIMYMALHGVPHTKIDEVTEFFKPFKEARNKRSRQMTDKINAIFNPYDISIDFDNDVMTLSSFNDGGSITERHILYALSLKITKAFPKGEKCLDFIKNTLGVNLSEKIQSYLLDENNIHYSYDLLGVLKGEFISKIYIDTTDECPNVRDLLKFSNKIGAISAYAYLGDVSDSVTGDKKAQKFEDDYIELLFDTISLLGFDCVTYMPSRNTAKQLERVIDLCKKHNLLQISGEDVNSSRQKFTCDKLKEKEFSHLVDSTYALIGHENMATDDLNKSMFSKQTKEKYPDISKRVEVYKQYGLNL